MLWLLIDVEIVRLQAVIHELNGIIAESGRLRDGWLQHYKSLAMMQSSWHWLSQPYLYVAYFRGFGCPTDKLIETVSHSCLFKLIFLLFCLTVKLSWLISFYFRLRSWLSFDANCRQIFSEIEIQVTTLCVAIHIEIIWT